MKPLRIALALVLALVTGSVAHGQSDGSEKLDPQLRKRADKEPSARSRVIVELRPGLDASKDLKALGGKLGRRLGSYDGQVVELSNGQLKKLAKLGAVLSVHDDRPVALHNYRTSFTVGATAVRQEYGYTGAGIGVAIVDSGISSWHDDLTGTGDVYPYGNQRVVKFVDFVNGRTLPYDDNGHGTHVAGTIAGSGYDSKGKQGGIAPGTQLVVLKVLNRDGAGTISNIIAAFDYAIANKKTYNIRVINLSLGAGVYESYDTDPLTLAAKKAVQAGIVVVAAAGNLGKNASGQIQYGGITSPGNAPWVLTIGASSTMGTLNRNDDTMASYSSRGPTAVNFLAKPDLVAPGTGTVSLSDPTSLFYTMKATYLADGSIPTAYKPYLSLSGTSMAAPVVAGSVALMLQANPSLKPNLVKAILQYTAEVNKNYNFLIQGAGFLNTKGAVRLAKFFTFGQTGALYPVTKAWSRHIIWGNHRLVGGYLKPTANAWADDDIVWGSAFDLLGDNIVWGSECDSLSCDNIVWGSDSELDNIVWGSSIVDDNIVWGSDLDDNIVWGSDCAGADCDNIVWGSTDLDDNIVWGSAEPGDNIVWGSSASDNIVWGSSGEDSDVWKSSSEDDTTFTDSELSADEIAAALAFDSDSLIGTTTTDPPPVEEQPAVAEPVMTVLVDGGF